MLTLGRNDPGTAIRLAVNFQTDRGTDIDPASSDAEGRSPDGEITSFIYGADAALVRLDTGDHLLDFIPDRAGKWHYRWETTGAGQTITIEGIFYVQASPFTEAEGGCRPYSGYGRQWYMAKTPPSLPRASCARSASSTPLRRQLRG